MKALFLKTLTRKYLVRVLLFIAEALAAKTVNPVDDELVDFIRKHYG